METKLALITILTKYKFLQAPETEVHTYIHDLLLLVYIICVEILLGVKLCIGTLE
jgi:hypothetical protein